MSNCPYHHISRPFGHFFAHATGDERGRGKLDWKTVCLALSLDPPFANREKLRKRLSIPIVRKTAKALTIDVLESNFTEERNLYLKAAVLSAKFAVAPQEWPEAVREAWRFPHLNTRLNIPRLTPSGEKPNQQRGGAVVANIPLPFEVACALFEGTRWSTKRIDHCEDAGGCSGGVHLQIF
jgi:hypothetical protein